MSVDAKTGAKQSASPYAFELLPPYPLFEAARVVKEGATKYGETFDHRNYNKISYLDHLNHCLAHIYAYLAGDRSDEHLIHGLVRLMFAVDTAPSDRCQAKETGAPAATKEATETE